MPQTFTIWGLISAFIGLLLLAIAKSAIHEIEAGIAFLIATLSFGFAAVVTAIKEAGNAQGASE